MSRLVPFIRSSARQFSTLRNAPKTALRQPSNLRQVAKRLQSDWVKPVSSMEVVLGIVIVGGGFSLWGAYLTKLMLDRMEEADKHTVRSPISPEEYREFKRAMAAKEAEEDEDDEDEEQETLSEDLSQVEEIVEETFVEVGEAEVEEIVESSKDTVIFIE